MTERWLASSNGRLHVPIPHGLGAFRARCNHSVALDPESFDDGTLAVCGRCLNLPMLVSLQGRMA